MNHLLILVSTLEIGGSELKFVRLANDLSTSGHRVSMAWLGPPHSLRPRIAKTVHTRFLHRTGKYSVRALWLLVKAIRELSPTTILSVNEYPMLYSRPAVRLSGKPCRQIVSINTSDYRGSGFERYAGFYKHVLRRMDTVVFGCERQREQWCDDFGLRSERTSVVYNGVPLEQFVPPSDSQKLTIRDRFCLPASSWVITCVAQLLPEKGHRYLLQGLAGVSGRDVYLLLVGDGPCRADLESLAAELGIRERVKFMGERESVWPALAAADAFCLPSIAVETFSNAALEASACGLPVLLTDVGGAAEMVVPGETGVLLRAGSWSSITAAISELAANPADGRRMGRLGRARVQSRFALADMTRAWLRVAHPGCEPVGSDSG